MANGDRSLRSNGRHVFKVSVWPRSLEFKPHSERSVLVSRGGFLFCGGDDGIMVDPRVKLKRISLYVQKLTTNLLGPHLANGPLPFVSILGTGSPVDGGSIRRPLECLKPVGRRPLSRLMTESRRAETSGNHSSG
jgi:hypothetical protein